jgi:hypothetical protein
MGLNNIILSISLLGAFLAGFLVAIKSVQLGLKWQIQTSEKKEPELKGPIQPIVEAVQQKRNVNANNNAQELVKEWLYGESK